MIIDEIQELLGAKTPGEALDRAGDLVLVEKLYQDHEYALRRLVTSLQKPGSDPDALDFALAVLGGEAETPELDGYPANEPPDSSRRVLVSNGYAMFTACYSHGKYHYPGKRAQWYEGIMRWWELPK